MFKPFIFTQVIKRFVVNNTIDLSGFYFVNLLCSLFSYYLKLVLTLYFLFWNLNHTYWLFNKFSGCHEFLSTLEQFLQILIPHFLCLFSRLLLNYSFFSLFCFQWRSCFGKFSLSLSDFINMSKKLFLFY